jgi:8-oxo-dGTP diphosphatase
MPTTAVYCAKCGHRVVRRPEGGRDRDTCPACATVFYQNPLPIAAAAVLDEDRRLLLVKRAYEPQKGRWCLPMGFAEVDERIREAALRELEEEAGIQGEVLALLDADSYESEHYGDLLIMTFEVRRIGGAEKAGDDAEEVGYFPLEALPPLAFLSNERAVAALVARHRDEWRIQDDFAGFDYDREQALLSDPLVFVLAKDAERIATLWAAAVQQHGSTPQHRRFPTGALIEEGRQILGQVTGRLQARESLDEMILFFRELGRARAADGLPLHELLSSLSLLKLELWRFARVAGAWENPLDVYRVLELSFLVNSFFDRAAYYLARGYSEATDDDDARRPRP